MASWIVPPRLFSLQTFSVYILDSVVNVCKGATFFEKYGYISLSQLSDKQFRRFFSRDDKTLLTLNMPAREITLKISTILHRDTGLGLFLSLKNEIGEVVRYYYISLQYRNGTKQSHKTKRYEKRVSRLTADTLHKLVHKVPQKVLGNDRTEHMVWIVSALF